jgi:hypothetical protein
MATAFEIDGTRIAQSVALPLRLLQGVYLFFVVLFGATLFYRVMNQQESRMASPLNLQEIKTSADELGDAERGNIIRRLEAELVSEPLDLQTLKKLVIYWAASGERARSDALALILAQRSFRDVEVQALALDIALRKQDYGQAARILDVVLRTKEKSQENTDVPFHLLSMLKRTASPAQVNEVKALIVRFLKDRNYDRAYYVWLDSLPTQDLEKVGLLFDGGFESNNRGLLFDWTFNRRKNVDVRVVSRGNSQADNALQIDFVKNTSPFADVSQTLYLSAGNYRLEGEVKAENLQNDRGLLWKVFCVNESNQLLTATPRRNGTSDWSSFAADFSVPQEKCVMQRLVLVLDAKSVLDQNISGRIWYDNLKITNLDSVQAE